MGGSDQMDVQSEDMMGGVGSDTGVMERVIFGAPDGDAAIIKQRQTLIFEAEKESYTPGQNIILDVVSRTKVLDMKRSYFSFKCAITLSTGASTLTLTAATVDLAGCELKESCRGLAGNEYLPPFLRAGTVQNNSNFFAVDGAKTTGTVGTALRVAQRYRWMRRDGTTGNFFSRFRILSRKGIVMEEITSYSDLHRLFHVCTWTNDEKEKRGAPYGTHAITVPVANIENVNGVGQRVSSRRCLGHSWSPFDPTVVNGVTADAPECVALGAGAANAVNNPAQYLIVAAGAYPIPKFHFVPICSGLWNIPQFLPLYIMEGVRFEFTLDTLTRVFHGSLVANGGDAATATTAITTYTITEFKLVAECVELSAGVKVALDGILSEGGIPLYISTAMVQDFTVANTTLNLRIMDRLTHTTAAWFWIVPAELTNADNLDHQHFRPVSVQWRLGTANMPDQPWSVADTADYRNLDPDLYQEFLKTIRGLQGVYFGKGVPDYQDWRRRRDLTDLSSRNLPGAYSYFTIGQSLQTSPGVDGSGTIIGDAASLELRLKLFAAPEGNSVGKFCVFYDRMLMLRDAGMIDVQV